MSDEEKAQASQDAAAVEASIEVEVKKVPAKVLEIRLLDVRESETALRGVDRENEEYKELLDSIKKHGVLENITVRECVDPVTSQKYYGLINGLQRFNCAKDAGFDKIYANVIVANDLEALEKQIILNAKRVETTPSQYTQQIKRILTLCPQLSMPDLASRLSCSVDFIYKRLSLVNLHKDIATLVDEKRICLSNAYAMAKLPSDEQIAFKDRAITQDPQQFLPQAHARVNEIAEAARKGKSVGAEVFQPRAFQRKMEELKTEMDRPTVGKVIIDKMNISTAAEGFAAGVAWALHLDPLSIADQKAKDEARKKEKEEAKARREQEKAEEAQKNVVADVLGVK